MSDNNTRSEHYDSAEVKRRVAFLDLMANEGVELKRVGTNFVGRCPFHQERSASFTVHGPAFDHGHCYGCGWNGDVFDFWIARRGGGFVDAVASLASFAAVPASLRNADCGLRNKKSDAADAAKPLRKERPPLPRMRPLTDAEVNQLGSLRSLSVEGIAAAAAEKRVGFTMWPQYLDRNGAWGLSDDAAPSWVITDRSRNVAQFRRLDGGLYVLGKNEGESREIKCWTKGSPTWPVGVSEIGARRCVLMVEGGADGLAAYHFLTMFKQLHRVAVTIMLGASSGICDEALSFFKGKRVRILMQEDEPKEIAKCKTKNANCEEDGASRDEVKPKRFIYPGKEAAARWSGQLSEAGAAVETFSLADLMRRDGKKVKDVNDLALMEECVWMMEPELKSAFVNFEF